MGLRDLEIPSGGLARHMQAFHGSLVLTISIYLQARKQVKSTMESLSALLGRGSSASRPRAPATASNPRAPAPDTWVGTAKEGERGRRRWPARD